MGKLTPKFRTRADSDASSQFDVNDLYRPFLIHFTTYVILSDQILTLMPSERNILLTMNEYSINDINPMHQCTDESPTHVIIFCIRFIADDIFQPIGGLLIYKQENQSAILAECLKAYINDLWKLGLHVVATVSPAFETFKGMLHHLVNKNMNTYSDAITYSVAPFKEIVHVYDFQFLLIKLQNLFKEGDIKFMEGTNEYRARWSDISLVLNLCSEFKILSTYLSDNKEVSRRVHIFTQQIFEQFLELEAQDVLSGDAGGVAVLLNCIRTFLKFTELNLVDLKLLDRMDCWDSLTHILHTMTFQKSNKRTCTKVKPGRNGQVPKLSKRKLNFQMNDNTDILAQDLNQKVCIGEQDVQVQCHSMNKNHTIVQNQHVQKKENGCDNVEVNESCTRNKQKKSKKKRNETSRIAVKDYNGDQSSTYAIDSKQSSQMQNEVLETVPIQCTSNTATGVVKERTESKNKIVEGDTNLDKQGHLIGTKPYCKTDSVVNSINVKPDSSDSKVCDTNNNGSREKQNINENGTREDICDNRAKVKKLRKKKKIKEGNFDVVINDAQKFFESFAECSTLKTRNRIPSKNAQNVSGSSNCENNSEKSCSSNANQSLEKSDEMSMNRNSSKHKDHFLYDGKKYTDDLSEFCSQSDEETEKCITKSCDKVPNIVDFLDNFDVNLSEEFEQNNVTYEILCTVLGMQRIIKNLIKRRVKIAKPDAFIVEHIDFLVTLIKRDRNKINPVYYYGHNYDFLNTELAFVTLQNKNGLYLVTK